MTQTAKGLAILGSTGSIGRSALSVVDAHPTRLKVVALAAGDNASLLAEQVHTYRPALVAMGTSDGASRLRAACGAQSLPPIAIGRDGLIAVATHASADIVLCASAGTAALEAVLAAIEAGKTIALANKEVLVMAGELVTGMARRRGVAILPVDSEHNAIHQCLHGRRSRGDPASHSDRFRWPVPRMDRGRTGWRRSGARVEAPDLADGAEDHRRLGDPDEQGARGHRGALALRRAGRSHRRGGASPVDRPLDGGAQRWVGHCSARRHGHAPSHSVRVLVSRSGGTRPFRRSISSARAGSTSTSPIASGSPASAWPTARFAPGGTLPAVLNAANEIAVSSFLDGRLGIYRNCTCHRADDERA